jgi:hypothetical protein
VLCTNPDSSSGPPINLDLRLLSQRSPIVTFNTVEDGGEINRNGDQRPSKAGTLAFQLENCLM